VPPAGASLPLSPRNQQRRGRYRSPARRAGAILRPTTHTTPPPIIDVDPGAHAGGEHSGRRRPATTCSGSISAPGVAGRVRCRRSSSASARLAVVSATTRSPCRLHGLLRASPEGRGEPRISESASISMSPARSTLRSKGARPAVGQRGGGPSGRPGGLEQARSCARASRPVERVGERDRRTRRAGVMSVDRVGARVGRGGGVVRGLGERFGGREGDDRSQREGRGDAVVVHGGLLGSGGALAQQPRGGRQPAPNGLPTGRHPGA
jgi:hypothetical protein